MYAPHPKVHPYDGETSHVHIEDASLSPMTRSCPLYPKVWYVIDNPLETFYHEDPLLHPILLPYIGVPHYQSPLHPRLVTFRYSNGPSHPHLGGPPMPPPSHPISINPHVLKYHRTPPPPPNDSVGYYYDDTHITNQPKSQPVSCPLYDFEPFHHVSSHPIHPSIPHIPISYSYLVCYSRVHIGHGPSSCPTNPPT